MTITADDDTGPEREETIPSVETLRALNTTEKEASALASQPAKPVPVEAVEAARRLLEIDDTGLVKEDDVNLVANTLLAMAGER